MEARIENDFEGWDGDTVFKLNNGQVWQQAEYKYTYHYAYRPRVKIIRKANGHYLQVEGLNDDLKVTQILAIEGQVNGPFQGWNGKTLIQLTNGQIWEQAQYHYKYLYAYRPEVMIYQSRGEWVMLVDGCNAAVPVRRIR